MTGFYEQHTGIAGADALAERHRIHGTSSQAKLAAQAFADGKTEPKPEPKPTSFADLDIEAISRRWNAPRRPAQQEG